MPLLQFNLTRFLFPSDPSLWSCPIQEGLPFIFGTVSTLLLQISAIIFLAGIIISSFYYFTAFGNEDRAKQAKQSLKWTFIGGVTIILSAIVIYAIAGLFSTNGEGWIPTNPLQPITGSCSVEKAATPSI